ncbi:hypothetical protein [Micromonospora sp. NPDC004704]
MHINRPWRIIAGAGAAALVAGLTAGAATADAGIELRDKVSPIQVNTQVDQVAADDSPESADSPYQSPFDSTNSASDSPGDPQWVDPSPESADSANASAADSPAPPPAKKATGTGDKGKPAPAKPKAGNDSPDDSPAPVRKRGGGGGDSANSGGSADSGD